MCSLMLPDLFYDRFPPPSVQTGHLQLLKFAKELLEKDVHYDLWVLNCAHNTIKFKFLAKENTTASCLLAIEDPSCA